MTESDSHTGMRRASVSQNKQPADKHLSYFFFFLRPVSFIHSFNVCLLRLRYLFFKERQICASNASSLTAIYSIIFTHSATKRQIKTNTPGAILKPSKLITALQRHMAISHNRLQLEHGEALTGYRTKPSQVQVHQLLCSEVSSVGGWGEGGVAFTGCVFK